MSMDDDTKALRDALEAGPTPGEWTTEDANSNHVAVLVDRVFTYICEVAPSRFSMRKYSGQQDEADATYIAAANPARIARILARLEAAEGALALLVAAGHITQDKASEAARIASTAVAPNPNSRRL